MATTPSDEMHPTPEQQARQHVYVINGSPDFLNIIRELLQDEHYNVTTTNFLPETFEAIAAARPSLLIIDLVPGDEAGWQLLAELQRSAVERHLPLLAVSTSPHLLDRAQTESDRFGADAYLQKPFDLDALLTEVERLIGPA